MKIINDGSTAGLQSFVPGPGNEVLDSHRQKRGQECKIILPMGTKVIKELLYNNLN